MTWPIERIRSVIGAGTGLELAGPIVTAVVCNERQIEEPPRGPVVRVRTERMRVDPSGNAQVHCGSADERVVAERVVGTDGPWLCVELIDDESSLRDVADLRGYTPSDPPTSLEIERTTWVVHDGDGTIEAEFVSELASAAIGAIRSELSAVGMTSRGQALVNLVRAQIGVSSGCLPLPPSEETGPAPSWRMLDRAVDLIAGFSRAVPPTWKDKELRSLSKSVSRISGAARILGFDAELCDSIDRLHQQVLLTEAVSYFAGHVPDIRAGETNTIGSMIRDRSCTELFDAKVSAYVAQAQHGLVGALDEFARSWTTDRLASVPTEFSCVPSAPDRAHELTVEALGAWRKATRTTRRGASRRVLQHAEILAVVAPGKKIGAMADRIAKSARGLLAEDARQRLLRDLAVGAACANAGVRGFEIVIGAHAEVSARRQRKRRRSLADHADRFLAKEPPAH